MSLVFEISQANYLQKREKFSIFAVSKSTIE